MDPIIQPSQMRSLPGEGIQKNIPLAQQQAQLKGQVEEFATFLYAQMFGEMRDAGKAEGEEEEGSIFGGGDTNYFMHFLDESVGRSFIHQGGSGLSDSLYKQLAGRLGIQAQGGGQ